MYPRNAAARWRIGIEPEQLTAGIVAEENLVAYGRNRIRPKDVNSSRSHLPLQKRVGVLVFDYRKNHRWVAARIVPLHTTSTQV